jgi:hypothetical protein
VVGAAAVDAFRLGHSIAGSARNARLLGMECIFVCGSVILVLPATSAEADNSRARHHCNGVVIRRVLLWWNGVGSDRLTIWHWIGCGCLLSALAMAKGPQPAGFFGCGVGAYLLIERRWRDLPGYCLCITMPIAATIAWGASIYHTGDGAVWLSYTRLYYSFEFSMPLSTTPTVLLSWH